MIYINRVIILKKMYIILMVIMIILICILIDSNNKRLNILESYIKTLEQKIERISLDSIDVNSVIEENNDSDTEINRDNDNIINFENPDTENLSMISEETAKKIWKQYLNNKQEIFDYTITSISIEQKKPNNFLDIPSIDTYGYQMADFTRKCYVIVCTLNAEGEKIEGFVDAYTGKVIGGYFSGV